MSFKTTSFKYTAFISYSHKDEATAQWLQQGVERYRVPARLQQSQRPDACLSPVPRRLHPVFRDREELASGESLSEAVESAMAQAAFLIVVCSPAAAKSRWVNEEIRRFRVLRPDGRILCLLAEGEPDRTSARCAFPEALLVNADGSPAPEPLAADLRPEADGSRLALLKIIAGMLEVGIDDLRQREVQRQVRRWAALAGVSALVAVITIGLAIVATAAREEAQLRRAQAEDLIGFMLGDLRSRLTPIGRLDLLDAVGDEAMSYYADLGDKATPEELLQRAIALRQIGEVRFAQGNFEPAQEAFEESRTQAQRLYDQDPSNDSHLFELGQAEFWVGYVQYQRGAMAAAATSMDRYLEISETLIERQPENPDFTMELAYAYSNIGTIERQRGNAEVALGHFENAVTINKELLQASPDDTYLQFDLGAGYSWLGSIRRDLGQLQASEAAFRQSLEIWSALADKGIDARHREKAADGALLLSDVVLAQGDVVSAVELTQEARSAFMALTETDPQNARYSRGLATSQGRLAEMLSLSGGWDPVATRNLKEAEALYQSLVTSEPGDQLAKNGLVQCWRLAAQKFLTQGDAAQALEQLTGASAWVEERVASGETSSWLRHTAVLVADTQASALSALALDAEAEMTRTELLRAWLGEDVTQPERLAVKVRQLVALGRIEEAATAVAALEATGFQHPGYNDVIERYDPPIND